MYVVMDIVRQADGHILDRVEDRGSLIMDKNPSYPSHPLSLRENSSEQKK